jgi:hypothetical protein
MKILLILGNCIALKETYLQNIGPLLIFDSNIIGKLGKKYFKISLKNESSTLFAVLFLEVINCGINREVMGSA